MHHMMHRSVRSISAAEVLVLLNKYVLYMYRIYYMHIWLTKIVYTIAKYLIYLTKKIVKLITYSETK